MALCCIVYTLPYSILTLYILINHVMETAK
ncbi:DUF5408 family protein [Aquirufa salirivi]|uniref:DUF5408 family protein n=1 Tax=Aquirufa salirivi TaxID=3104729 RepID=A0ABW8RWD2_9BACT